MIKVKYEEYRADYDRRDKEISFYSLDEFENWFFGLCKGTYENDASVPDPDNAHGIWKDGPSCLKMNCRWIEGKTYWVHQISSSAGIIYSDGHHTNHQRHWNEEVKDMCRRMIRRKKNPTFNFA